MTLHSCKVGQDGAAVIADSPRLKNLRKLYLDDPAFHQVVGDGSAEIILSSPNLPNVEDLQLGLRNLAPYWTKMIRQDLQRKDPNRSGPDR